jgi:hypothetical protein
MKTFLPSSPSEIGRYRLEALKARVYSAKGAPLAPCHPARARELVKKGRAQLITRKPLSIQLTDRIPFLDRS